MLNSEFGSKSEAKEVLVNKFKTVVFPPIAGTYGGDFLPNADLISNWITEFSEVRFIVFATKDHVSYWEKFAGKKNFKVVSLEASFKESAAKAPEMDESFFGKGLRNQIGDSRNIGLLYAPELYADFTPKLQAEFKTALSSLEQTENLNPDTTLWLGQGGSSAYFPKSAKFIQTFGSYPFLAPEGGLVSTTVGEHWEVTFKDSPIKEYITAWIKLNFLYDSLYFGPTLGKGELSYTEVARKSILPQFILAELSILPEPKEYNELGIKNYEKLQQRIIGRQVLSDQNPEQTMTVQSELEQLKKIDKKIAFFSISSMSLNGHYEEVDSLVAAFESYNNVDNDWTLVLQGNAEELENRYGNLDFIKVVGFAHHNTLLRQSEPVIDLWISSSGVGVAHEMAGAGIPSISLSLPGSPEQAANAKILESRSEIIKHLPYLDLAKLSEEDLVQFISDLLERSQLPTPKSDKLKKSIIEAEKNADPFGLMVIALAKAL